MADLKPNLIVRVKALQPRRRRAGLEFSASPRDLGPSDFGQGLGAMIALAAVLADPLLACWLVRDGEEHPITDEDVQELAAMIEAHAGEGEAVALAADLAAGLDAPTDTASEESQPAAGETAPAAAEASPAPAQIAPAQIATAKPARAKPAKTKPAGSAPGK